MRRVVVVGGPGSGKSTVAAIVARRLDALHVELDELWWDPGWLPVGRDELRSRLRERLGLERWVVDGNYLDEIADLAWPCADTIVWLDLPRGVAVRRAVWRSARRALGATELWHGNREALAVLSPVSIMRLMRRWPDYPKGIEKAVTKLDVAEGAVVRLRSDAEVNRWLETA